LRLRPFDRSIARDPTISIRTTSPHVHLSSRCRRTYWDDHTADSVRVPTIIHVARPTRIFARWARGAVPPRRLLNLLNRPYARARPRRHSCAACHHTTVFRVRDNQRSNNYGPWQFSSGEAIPLITPERAEGKLSLLWRRRSTCADWALCRRSTAAALALVLDKGHRRNLQHRVGEERTISTW